MVSINDLLIFSTEKKKHHKHLDIVFSRSLENELYACPKKYYFLMNKIDLPGLLIRRNSLQVNSEKVGDTDTFPKPSSFSDL